MALPFTPHDLYDYDANQTPVLVTKEENGVPRKLLIRLTETVSLCSGSN